MKGAVVSLLDEGLLMRGFVVPAEAMALWTVVDEDLLCCLCCAESPVGAGCDGFVGGCGWWFRDAGLVAEAENLLMSLAVSTWWLPLVCVGGSKSAWIYV